MNFCVFQREYPTHRVLHIGQRIAWAPGLFVSPFSPFEAYSQSLESLWLQHMAHGCSLIPATLRANDSEVVTLIFFILENLIYMYSEISQISLFLPTASK